MTRLLSLSLLLLAGSLGAKEPAPTPEQVRFFESKVRPLFVKHCQECHGPKKQNAGLRLDSAAAFRAGGESGSLIAPGKPDESLLIHAVRHEGPKMPPKKQLAADEIAALVEWVRTGAAWPAETSTTRKGREITAEDRAFWAFQPVRDHAPPVVTNNDWPLNPIDRFLLARMEAKGLSPVSLADRRTLIRRVTFDLTGLPPKPEDIDTFVNDASPQAFERLVERLLASPA